MKNSNLTIIAGPCSVDQQNKDEIMQIANIEVNGKKAIAGTRVVGLKSRTALNSSGDGMGMDFDVFHNNLKILMEGGNINHFDELPSVAVAKEIIEKTNMLVATEIMNPLVQLPSWEREIFRGRLMPWNPSVMQLGWPIEVMAKFAARNDWPVGIKNGKTLGQSLDVANDPNWDGTTPLEKTWSGLVKYAAEAPKTILIHRGVDVPEKGNYRNAVVHEVAKRTKLANPQTRLYFDPSHSYGPKMQEEIVGATISAMQTKLNENEFLYDGILVEAGTSQTDTEQHISLVELQQLVDELATFRDLSTSRD